MLFRLLFILPFLFALSACEKVKDSPAPDPVAKLEVGSINIRMTNQRVSEIKFFSEEQLKGLEGQFSIEITRQPYHGSISLDPNRKVFIYQANEGWFGRDSAEYKVCSNQSCKTGQINFELVDTIPPPCIPIAQNLTYTLNPGIQTITLPDSFPCQATISAIFDNPVPFNISFSNGQIQTSFPEFTNQNYQLKYVICTALNHCDTGNITIQIRPDSNYCQARFLPNDDEITFLSFIQAKSTPYETLFLNDPPTCPNDLIKESLSIVSGPSRGTAFLQSTVQGRFIRYARDSSFQSGRDSLVYSLKSRSGKTAQVKLFIKII
jgi:hypothetical protein